ncbi:MAG: NAD(P)-dependent oxidoreductase [Rhodospirillales bacterium]|nr:NAD(P)-dependent oxidoreductase [Rhodospirillales bacterium]
MKKLLVALTGATGVVGRGILEALVAAGHGVRPVGRGEYDLSRPEGAKWLELEGVDVLVHAAGITEESARGRHAATIAGEGLRALAARAKEQGIARLVYISSAHVYGPLEGRIDEASPPDPRGDYARLHLESERIAAASGIACDILRPCNVYGMPKDLAHFERWALIPFGFPRDAVDGRRIVLKTPGLQTRNFVSAVGVGRAAAARLAEPPVAERVRNVAGRDTLSVRDFAARVAAVAAPILGSAPEIVAPAADGPAPPPLDYAGSDGPQDGDLDGFLAGMMRACLRMKDGRTA